MAIPRTRASRLIQSTVAGHSFFLGGITWHFRPEWLRTRRQLYATDQTSQSQSQPSPTSSFPHNPSPDSHTSSAPSSVSSQSGSSKDGISSSDDSSLPPGWEDDPDYNISAFSQLPHRHFGFNQHMLINAEFKEALRQVLWQFRAPIRYAFAYGSGVFPQSKTPATAREPSPHPNPPEAVSKWQAGGEKNIDFIFGVSFTQHWHSLNLHQHCDHYSFLGSLGSSVITRVQDKLGAGAYFNPYVNLNGLSIKYGVVNLDTLYRDLSDWDTLYLAGRLQKPVKILRDDPRIRLANQINLISALRTALLMLPERFTERDLYFKIAGLSYTGDPRMRFRAERPDKVYAIVDSQMPNFRQLYYPLIADLPNIDFADDTGHKFAKYGPWIDDPELNGPLAQDMDPTKRGNMVRRLPRAFRCKLYTSYQSLFQGPSAEFSDLTSPPPSSTSSASSSDTVQEDAFVRRTGTEFDKKIAMHPEVAGKVKETVKKTTTWPTVIQSFKGILTAGPVRSWKYVSEKRAKSRHKAVAIPDGANSNISEGESEKSGKEKIE